MKNLPTAALYLSHVWKEHRNKDMLYLPTLQYLQAATRLFLSAGKTLHPATKAEADLPEPEQVRTPDSVQSELAHPSNADERIPSHEV